MADSIGEGLSSVNKGPLSVNEGSSYSTRSVIDALKAPALSDLTRKRSVHCNPLPKGKCRVRGKGSSEPKSITASQRVKEVHRNNERSTGQICWINRENDVEIWNRIVGIFNWLKPR